MRCGDVDEPLDVGDGVDEDPPRPVLVDRGQEPPGPGVGRELQRRVPQDLDQPGLDRALQVEPDARRGGDQIGWRLVEPGQQAALPALGALQQEAEAEQRLAGARGAHHQRAGARQQPAAQHRVQAGDPGAQRHAREALSGGRRRPATDSRRG